MKMLEDNSVAASAGGGLHVSTLLFPALSRALFDLVEFKVKAFFAVLGNKGYPKRASLLETNEAPRGFP